MVCFHAMSMVDSEWWESVEQWRATAFLIGGIIFGADAVLLTADLVAGTEPGAFGQAFVGAAWTATFIGLLGFYPSLADRRRRVLRAAVVFAVIGLVTMAAMAVASLGYATGLLNGELSGVIVYFLPGVFLGIVGGFGLFGVVSLLTPIYSRSIGLLFLLLPVTFLFNLGTGIADIGGLPKILGVVCVLSLTMLTTGYLLRTGHARAAHGQETTPRDTSAG